jgi:hypothetical protein
MMRKFPTWLGKRASLFRDSGGWVDSLWGGGGGQMKPGFA